MNKLSDGSSNTLGGYRKIAIALTGSEESEAVEFFDTKIAESPDGENEKVIADESQMLMLIGSML